MTAYPPEPWRLAGQTQLSVWLLPAGKRPKLPEGVEPVTAGGHATVFTAWIDYRAPGQLSYHELLAPSPYAAG